MNDATPMEPWQRPESRWRGIVERGPGTVRLARLGPTPYVAPIRGSTGWVAYRIPNAARPASTIARLSRRKPVVPGRCRSALTRPTLAPPAPRGTGM